MSGAERTAFYAEALKNQPEHVQTQAFTRLVKQSTADTETEDVPVSSLMWGTDHIDHDLPASDIKRMWDRVQSEARQINNGRSELSEDAQEAFGIHATSAARFPSTHPEHRAAVQIAHKILSNAEKTQDRHFDETRRTTIRTGPDGSPERVEYDRRGGIRISAVEVPDEQETRERKRAASQPWGDRPDRVTPSGTGA